MKDNSYIEQCQRVVEELIDATFKAAEDYIEMELRSPTEEQLNRMIADREIKAMRELERQAGVGTET